MAAEVEGVDVETGLGQDPDHVDVAQPEPTDSLWREQADHAERAVLATIDFALAGEYESFGTADLRNNIARMLAKG